MPEIVSRGFMSMEESADVLQEARQVVMKTIEGSTAEERGDWGVMQEKIRADLKRYHDQADLAPSADHAGDPGSIAAW